MSRKSHGLLALCFFFSGATSLVLEVAWAKELTYALGNSIHATSTVIAAFMAGLGLGSIAAGRPIFAHLAPIKTYALLQLLIGIAGFVSISVLRSTAPVFEVVYQDLAVGPSIFLLLRFAVVFPLMAAPATLMGMSLPLVVEARSHEELGVASNAGMIYGLNTLGAVTGTYVAGFLLIPILGLSHTCMAVGIIDFGIGLALFALHRTNVREIAATNPSQAETLPKAPGAALSVAGPVAHTAEDRAPRQKQLFALVFCVAGFLAMVYEVAWFRLLTNVLGGTVHSFTSMLGIYLIGVGLGSVLGTRFLPKNGAPLGAVVLGLFAIGGAAISSLMLANSLPARYASLFWALDAGSSLAGYVMAQAVTAAIVVLPTSLAMGALFPIALRAYESLGAGHRDRKNASDLYALNTFGGIGGSLMAGFVFLPQLGQTPTLIAAGGCSALLALLVLAVLMNREAVGPRAGAGLLGISLTALMVFLVPDMNHLELHRGVFYRMQATPETSKINPTNTPGLRLFYYREGLHGSLSITGNKDLSLRLSGKPVATTEFHDRVHLALLGHLPALFAHSTRDVAVIGLGMGVALDALVTHEEIESITVAELEPAIIEVQNYFEPVNRNSLADPRVELVLEDGRTHLTYSQKKYDIITSDPISPIIAGAANLYTEDFYRLSAERLNPGGVFCQWWQMTGVTETTYKNVLATMRRVFPHLRVFVYGADSMVIGSMQPIRTDWFDFERRFMAPAVQQDLAFYNLGSPMHILGLLWADTGLVDRYVQDHDTINTDDSAWLEHQMPLDHYSPRPNASIPTRMARAIIFGRLRAIEETVPGLPRAELIEHVLRNPPTKNSRVHQSQLPAIQQYIKNTGQDGLRSKLAGWHSERKTESKERRHFTTLERAFERAIDDGDTAGAEQSLRKMETFPQLPITYYWNMTRVDLLAKEGRTAEALELLERMRRRTPSRPAVYRRGQALAEKLGYSGLAARRAEDLVRMQPRNVTSALSDEGALVRDLISWADELKTASLFEEAIGNARRAIEIDPENISARIIWGYSLLQLDRQEEALDLYRAALALDPESVGLNTKIASVLMRMHRRDEALAHLLSAAEFDPRSSQTHLRIGQALIEMERSREAEEYFRTALDLDPRSAGAHAVWAELLQRQGKSAEALLHYEAALEIDPLNERYRKRLKETRRKVIR